MKKIITPIDFSDCSKNALKNAIALAEKLHTEIVIFHALSLPMGYTAEVAPAPITDMGLEAMEKTAKTNIEKLIGEFPQLKKVPHHYEIQYGPIHDHIQKMTEEMDVEMIVMGTHGAKGFQKILLGSNAYRIMKNVKCPVIAIPENADILNMKNLAFAIDCHNVPSHDVIVSVVNLTKASFGTLHLVHIDDNEVETKQQVEIGRRLEKYLKGIKHKFHFVHHDDIEEGLVEFSEANHIDLLMLVAKHHGFLERIRHGSHTKSMIFNIPMPLMLLHE